MLLIFLKTSASHFLPPAPCNSIHMLNLCNSYYLDTNRSEVRWNKLTESRENLTNKIIVIQSIERTHSIPCFMEIKGNSIKLPYERKYLHNMYETLSFKRTKRSGEEDYLFGQRNRIVNQRLTIFRGFSSGLISRRHRHASHTLYNAGPKMVYNA